MRTPFIDEITRLAKMNISAPTNRRSIALIVEKLRLVNPLALNIGSRLKFYVSHIVTRLNLPDAWEFEVAAMFALIGCAELPHELMGKIDNGTPLNPKEESLVRECQVGGGCILKSVSDLTNVADMIAAQYRLFDRKSEGDNFKDEDRIALGGHLLRVSFVLDQILAQELPVKSAIIRLRGRVSDYVPEILNTLDDLEVRPRNIQYRQDIKSVYVNEIDTRMVLDQDVFSSDGSLLAKKGTAITYALLGQLRSATKGVGVVEPIQVIVQDRINE